MRAKESNREQRRAKESENEQRGEQKRAEGSKREQKGAIRELAFPRFCSLLFSSAFFYSRLLSVAMFCFLLHSFALVVYSRLLRFALVVCASLS